MPTEHERNLLHAAEEGHVQEIRHLLMKGTSPDVVVDGWTALERASINNQCDTIKALIESGADPNREDEDGQTPLYWTAKKGHREASDTLIACGAHYDMPDLLGSTPLHCAAQSGHKEVVIVLLKRGADPARPCKEGNTPLHLASKSGHQDIVELIIALGIDPNPANSTGESPLIVATRSGNANVVKSFIENTWATSQLVQFLRLHQALAIAARQRHHDIYGLISQKLGIAELHKVMTYCNKSHRDDTFHKTALEWALKNQDKYLISELLRHEFKWHRDSKEQGLCCLQAQLTYEENLKLTITQFKDQYPKDQSERRVAGFMAVLPILLPFCMYFYDMVFDGVLSKNYYSCSDLPRMPEKCEDLKRSETEYRFAFASIIMLMAASLGASIFVVVMSKGFQCLVFDMRQAMYGRHNQNTDYRLVHKKVLYNTENDLTRK